MRVLAKDTEGQKHREGKTEKERKHGRGYVDKTEKKALNFLNVPTLVFSSITEPDHRRIQPCHTKRAVNAPTISYHLRTLL